MNKVAYSKIVKVNVGRKTNIDTLKFDKIANFTKY